MYGGGEMIMMVHKLEPSQNEENQTSETTKAMSRELVILALMPITTFCLPTEISESDINKALQNIEEMENDLVRFYKQWNSLMTKLSEQGIHRAMEYCQKEQPTECTQETRRALSTCIASETQTIHDEIVKVYDEKIRKPWQREFKRLKDVLENPIVHESIIQETIWTVHKETLSVQSVRYRFYESLVNFQPINAAPGVLPIDKVFKVCTERLFPQPKIDNSL